MQNEEKKESKLKRFWYKHGEDVKIIGKAVLIFGTPVLTGIFGAKIGYSDGFIKGHRTGFKQGMVYGGKKLQLFIKKEVPEAYKMIDDVVISKKNL